MSKLETRNWTQASPTHALPSRNMDEPIINSRMVIKWQILTFSESAPLPSLVPSLSLSALHREVHRHIS